MKLLRELNNVLYATSLSVLGGFLFIVEIFVKLAFDITFFWGFTREREYKKHERLKKYVDEYIMEKDRGDIIHERTRVRKNQV